MQDSDSTDDVIQRLDEAVAVIQDKAPAAPVLGVVAGSGLGMLGDLFDDAVRFPYGEIPHMPVPSVEGHAGELVLGNLEGLRVAVLSGRAHRYEGHPMDDVVFGVRMLGRLGTANVLLTNAAGGIPPWLGPGSLCRIVDHVNMMGENPLRGPNVDGLGPRFPDMTHAYCPDLGERMDRAAADAAVTLHRGVYAAMMGPSYETPAEIRMLRTLGVTCVGMSTVPEAIALRHMGVRVGGISVVSNAAAGVGSDLLDHSEVKDVALEAGPRLIRIVRSLAKQLAQEPLT